MTIAQVKASEKQSPVFSDFETLRYKNIKVSEYETQVSYYFKSGTLAKVIYEVETNFSSAMTLHLSYQAIQSRMEDKYGKAKGGYRWTNDTYRKSDWLYGRAIQDGDLSIGFQWIYGKSDIIHFIKKEDDRVAHVVIFTPQPTDDF